MDFPDDNQRVYFVDRLDVPPAAPLGPHGCGPRRRVSVPDDGLVLAVRAGVDGQNPRVRVQRNRVSAAGRQDGAGPRWTLLRADAAPVQPQGAQPSLRQPERGPLRRPPRPPLPGPVLQPPPAPGLRRLRARPVQRAESGRQRPAVRGRRRLPERHLLVSAGQRPRLAQCQRVPAPQPGAGARPGAQQAQGPAVGTPGQGLHAGGAARPGEPLALRLPPSQGGAHSPNRPRGFQLHGRVLRPSGPARSRLARPPTTPPMRILNPRTPSILKITTAS